MQDHSLSDGAFELIVSGSFEGTPLMVVFFKEEKIKTLCHLWKTGRHASARQGRSPVEADGKRVAWKCGAGGVI